MKAVIRPFVFTKAALYDRWYHWVAEWLGLFANIVYLLTLGYIDPSWKFIYLTYILKKNHGK